MLHIGDTYTVIVEETNIFGNGVCHVEGVAVFVEGAMIGDKCVIEITKVLTSYAYARCVEILISSTYREMSKCPYSNKCGGCSFDGIDLNIENEVKKKYVSFSFLKQGIKADVEKTQCPVSQSYRNKVVLFYDNDRYGYLENKSNKIVPHTSCLLNEAIFDKIADFVGKELIGTTLRSLYLRKGYGENGEIMVCPIFYKKTNILSFVGKLIKKFPNVKTVLQGVNNEKSFVLENTKYQIAYGDGYIYDTLCGLNFRISPESFYQVNHDCAELMYEKAISLADLSEGKSCADLFCGTGTIGIISAKKTGAKVYGVEIVEKAIEDAKNNAELNSVRNIKLKAMDAKEFNEKVDVCIIDPPRKGCTSFMLNTLNRILPEKIVYISCNVDTMTRDIKALSDNYKISSPVSVFNLFPRTSHVECIACLKRKN